MSSPSDVETVSGLDESPPPDEDADEIVWGDMHIESASGQDKPSSAGAEEGDVVWADHDLEPIKLNEPRTVKAGFKEFCEQLVPKYTESETAVSTLQTIENCLAKTFDLAFIAPYGSRGHGTNVRDFSAIDSFAVVPSDELFEESGKSLEKVKDVIADALPGVFITEGRPVVAVPFGEQRSERHHIVPAYYAGTRDDHDVFAIPAPRDRWIRTCPAAHSIWINELDRTLKNNLKSFIRVVKAWSYFNDDIVWRYYLELCAADYLKHDAKIAYSRNLCGFFDYLESRELAPFEDTAGCNEPVYGTSIADRDAAMTAILDTHKMARKAWTSEQNGNIADAFYWWRKIFDWQFVPF